MNGLRVDFDKACQVVHLLCESTGIRAIQRLTGLHQETILNILETAGQKAAQFLDARIRNVNADMIQADEVHTYVFSKQQNTDKEDLERGEQFAFMSCDRRSKLIINWRVGKRTRENATDFLTDLKCRMANRFQLTTDNWHVYSGFTGAVRSVWGDDVDYATETKVFAYTIPFYPRRVIAIKRKRKIGSPNMAMATTCHAERTNLSLRLFTRRFTRCTLGYSKKLENLRHAVALFVWYFDFARKNGAHGFTPAFAAGLAPKEPMTIRELLESAF